jgi:hypothetical protein
MAAVLPGPGSMAISSGAGGPGGGGKDPNEQRRLGPSGHRTEHDHGWVLNLSE